MDVLATGAALANGWWWSTRTRRHAVMRHGLGKDGDDDGMNVVDGGGGERGGGGDEGREGAGRLSRPP